MTSLLDELRGLSTVDCDTLDPEVPARLGPLGDCTSNQAIAYAQLSKLDDNGKPLYQQLMIESAEVAHWMYGKQSDATVKELAVELMMVGLSLQMAPHTTGFLHVQTNPKLAYSSQKTIKNAERIVSHFKHLAPELDANRICIKIPCTWEGLQACSELEARGISTLATTVFCMQQAASAALVGCRYVAPYVNELRVHFEPGYVDPNKEAAMKLCGEIQQYLETPNEQRRRATQVVVASLTSIEEIMQLAGLRHITISSPLLAELAATPAAGWNGATIGLFKKPQNSLEEQIQAAEFGNKMRLLLGVDDAWRMELTRAEGGRSEGKLIQAINIFADMQDKLEEIVEAANVVIGAGRA